jgi:hypothetical protein
VATISTGDIQDVAIAFELIPQEGKLEFGLVLICDLCPQCTHFIKNITRLVHLVKHTQYLENGDIYNNALP